MPFTGAPATFVPLKVMATCESSGRVTTIVGKPPPWISKASRLSPPAAVPRRMRYMVPPLTPFPSVKSTGAVTAVADGLALGETDARVVGEGWMDTAAVAAGELPLLPPLNQPPP